MTDHPEVPDDDDSDSPDEDQPIQGQVRHNNVSARVPEGVGAGVFSNGVMILTGAFELVIDFVLRMGEQQKIVARVILPHPVAKQFAGAFKDNITNYENRFGQLPELPKPLPQDSLQGSDSGIAGAEPEGNGNSVSHPENQLNPPQPPQIDAIYDDLKLPDEMLSGAYANAVLIRHSGTEFCFDFITNVYPRSAVSARVFLAAPHAGPFLASLQRSTTPPPGTSQEFA